MRAGCKRARPVVTRGDGGFDSRPALWRRCLPACQTPTASPWVLNLPLTSTHASSGPHLRGIGGDGSHAAACVGLSADPICLPLARIAVLGHDGAGHRHGGLGYSLPGECAPLPQACRRHTCSGASALQRPTRLTALGVALTRSLLKRYAVQSRAARPESTSTSPCRRGIASRSRRSVVHVNQGGST